MQGTLSRIQKPLFLERDEIVLREAMSAVEQRAYFRTLRDIRKQIGQLDRSNQRALRRLMQDARKTIIGAIADSRDFRAFHLRELMAEFEATMGVFGTRYRTLMVGTLGEHIDLGSRSIVEPLMGVKGMNLGRTVGAVGLSPDVIESAVTMSAELVNGITSKALRNINREVRFVSMGIKSSHDAIGAIGRNLTDPSVFGTISTRAETILRTETGRIRSQAALAAKDRVKDVPLPDGMKLKKEWIWSGIGREEHAELDGVRVDPDEDFTDGFGNSGQGPGMFGAPESDISCGCSVGLVIEEKEAA